MAEQLKPMQVNPGDPITSELLASIVANINIINTMANSTTSGAGGSDGGANPVSVQVIESGRLKVPCNTAGTGKKTVTFTKTFAARPNVMLTLWQASSANFLKHKYLPVVTTASATEFTIQMLPVGATANGEIYVQWVAVS
jgi:hypothetical protein